MQVRTLAATSLLAGGAWLALGTAPALAVCDAYSGGCPSAPAGTGISGGGGGGATGGGGTTGGTGTGVSGTTSNAATLPLTGGELVLLTAIGAGALAGGTALVVAGRRKGSSAA